MAIPVNRSSASNNSERKPLHCTHCDMDQLRDLFTLFIVIFGGLTKLVQ
ncbi:unnamed protein product [Prunus armeniaca]